MSSLSSSCACAKGLKDAAMKLLHTDWTRLLSALPFPAPSFALSLVAQGGGAVGGGISASLVAKLIAQPPPLAAISEAKIMAMARWAMVYRLILDVFKLDMTLPSHQLALAATVGSAGANAGALLPLRGLDISGLTQLAAWAASVEALSQALKKDLKSIRSDAELHLAVQAALSSAGGKAQASAQAAVTLAPPAVWARITLACRLAATLHFVAEAFGDAWSRPGCAGRITAKIQAMIDARIAANAFPAGFPVMELSVLAGAMAAAETILRALDVDALAPDGLNRSLRALSLYARLDMPSLAMSFSASAHAQVGATLAPPPLAATVKLAQDLAVDEVARVGRVEATCALPLYDAALSLAGAARLSLQLGVPSGGIMRSAASRCGSACPLH